MINVDKEIQSKNDDILGRKEFAINLAKAINHSNEDSKVIGIHGEWGSGKTSIINMVLEELDKGDKNKPIIVDFKPWYFSGQDQLLEQFFQLLSDSIKYEFISSKNLSKKADLIGKNLKKLSKIIKPFKFITPFVGVPSEMMEKVSNTLNKAGECLEIEPEIFNPILIKKEISDQLSELKRKIVIVIDDIDRLTKGEIREIFQLVKTLADFPNTTYLLSFDKTIVCESLKEVQAGNPSKYLEKIIHFSVEIPKISFSDKEKYLTKNLDLILKNEKFDEEQKYYWHSVYLRGLNYYFRNLREINIFLNSFRFEYSLLKGEVNTVDIIAITAIKAKDHNLYQFIKENAEVFCGSNSDPNYTSYFYKALDKKKYKTDLINSYNSNKDKFHNIDLIEPVLKEIFPYFTNLFSSMENVVNSSEMLRRLRIASPEHFDKIFSLSIPDNKISNMEIRKILNVQDNLTTFSKIFDSFNYQKKGELIDLLHSYLPDIKKENLLTLVKVLAPYAEKSYEQNDDEFTSFSHKIQFLISNIVDRYHSSMGTRLEVYKSLSDLSEVGAYLCSSLLWEMAEKIGVKGEGTIIRDMLDQSQFKDDFYHIEKTMVNKIKDLAKNNLLHHHHKMIFLIYSWKRANDQEAKDFVINLIRSEDGLLSFLTGILSYSYGSKGKTASIGKKYIDDFTNENELVQRVRNIKSNKKFFKKLPDKTQEAIDALLRRIDNPKYHIDYITP
jgi:predicted KAP-like P-loop ATPase